MAYNLFAQQKQQNYPNAQTAGYHAQPVQQTQQAAQPTVTPTARPAGKPAGTVAIPAIDPNSDTSGMDALSSMYTSPQDEERMRKASVANQRIMAVADALRHIGNIYNTVNYAPAQQLNSPVLEEQARYEKGKALRDKANLTYLNYQQAKAAQDAKAKQWEADFNLKVADAARKAGYTEAQIQNMRDRLANQRAYQEGSLALRERLGTAQQKERERHNKVAERQGQQRIGIASQNAKNMQNYRQWKMNGGGGNMPDYEVITENTLNDDGRIVSQKKTRTVKRGGQSTTTTKTTKKTLPGQTKSTTTTGKGKKKLPGT